MNRSPFSIAITFALAIAISPNEALTQPTPSDGSSLLATQPDASSWSLEYVYQKGLPDGAPPRPTSATVTKWKDQRRDQITLSNGSTTENWRIDPIAIVGNQSGEGYTLLIPGLNESSKALVSGDFPNLAWITPTLASGKANRDGRECLVYSWEKAAIEEPSPPNSENETDPDSIARYQSELQKYLAARTANPLSPNRPTRAFIDAESLRPVALEDDQKTITYRFDAPAPSSAPEMPAGVRQEWERYTAHQQKLRKYQMFSE